MYSASVVLKATDFYILLIQDIEADPKMKQHPDVLLRSTTLPTQSAWVYPWSLKLPAVYLSPWLIVPRRYLNRFLAPIQWMWWGSTICWLKVFTAKHTFGREFTKNIRAPTSCRYSVGFSSTGSTVFPLNFLKLSSIGVDTDLQSIIPNLSSNFTTYFS